MTADSINKDKLAGKVAIVTGGGRGLGRATAMAFAEAGASVMVSARSAGEVEETAAMIKDAGGRAAFCPADVTDIDALRKMLAVTEEKLGAPSVLVNNAGGSPPGTSGAFEKIDPEKLAANLNINLIAAMVLSRLVLPGMLERKEGCIINVASGSAMVGMSLLLPYCTSKTAIVRFSEALAIEVYDRGVTAFSMTPGNVATKLTDNMYERRNEICDNWPEGFPWVMMAGHSFRDSGWYPPERGAELMRFLASGKADRLTGRFFSVHYDENQLVAEADRIEREQLYALRIPTLDGIEPPLVYKKPTVFYSKDVKVGD